MKGLRVKIYLNRKSYSVSIWWYIWQCTLKHVNKYLTVTLFIFVNQQWLFFEFRLPAEPEWNLFSDFQYTEHNHYIYIILSHITRNQLTVLFEDFMYIVEVCMIIYRLIISYVPPETYFYTYFNSLKSNKYR